MATIENYEWNDVILYAKGWYERRRIGRLDGKYPISMTYKHMNDIAKRMFESKEKEK